MNINNIGTKSVNMSDIMVYLAMFSTTIDEILCFWVLIKWKLVIILSPITTLWNLGLFFISEDTPLPPLIFNFLFWLVPMFWKERAKINSRVEHQLCYVVNDLFQVVRQHSSRTMLFPESHNIFSSLESHNIVLSLESHNIVPLPETT